MNLEQFVETCLMQIVSGVRKAQVATRLEGRHHSEADLVNPSIMYSADGAPKGKFFATMERNLVHLVEFDVALTTVSSSDTGGGVNLAVAGIGLKAGASGRDEETAVSRVKFHVPIALPRTEDEHPLT
ncbi:MAG TPA: hypothetical protein VFT98_15040 [Myxococcota bacterium]|nr:hypothetical protein [Myxococcota bacterium]